MTAFSSRLFHLFFHFPIQSPIPFSPFAFFIITLKKIKYNDTAYHLVKILNEMSFPISKEHMILYLLSFTDYVPLTSTNKHSRHLHACLWTQLLLICKNSCTMVESQIRHLTIHSHSHANLALSYPFGLLISTWTVAYCFSSVTWHSYVSGSSVSVLYGKLRENTTWTGFNTTKMLLVCVHPNSSGKGHGVCTRALCYPFAYIVSLMLVLLLYQFVLYLVFFM